MMEQCKENETMKNYKIAVAGTGYVGLSIATLLSQHHQVTAVDIVPEKVELINNRKSPIQDDYIEKYLAEKELNLTATLDAKTAYTDADFVVIAAPTNYDSQHCLSVWHYDNPFVILVSAMILLLFLQIDFKNKIINELAKGCFTCFLFHTPFVYHLNTEKAATSTIFYLIVHQFSVAIVLFMVSYIIYKIYAFCTKGLIKIITPLCDRVSLSVGSLEKGKN